MKFLSSFFVIFLISIFFVSEPQSYQAVDQSADCFSTKWPHEESELKPDPSLHFGRLANGFRFVLKTNHVPQNRVAVLLNVEAGSLHEQEPQRGLAHFLEHMVFNGSTHFKPGELIEYFQSIGMSFGGDTNAYTTYTDTVYKIILPGGSAEELDQGLLVMSDYAGGALLLEEEIERERGVILAEKTARDSVNYRSHLARTSFVLDGTALPQRQPIGTEQVLKNAGKAELKAFYEHWYRPDNMILSVVGDFDIDAARELIVKHFGMLKNSEGGVCPDYGRVVSRGIEGFYYHETALGSTEVFIETISNKEPVNDSLQVQTEQIHRYLAAMIVNHRLSRLEEDSDTVFSSASYYDSIMLDRYRLSGIRARTTQQQWRKTLAAMQQSLGQIIAFGVSEREVSRVRQELLADLEQGVLGAETRDSLRLASQIVSTLNENRVFLSPVQESELFEPIISATGAEDINRVIKRAWSNETRLIQLVGDAVIDAAEPQQALKNYYLGLAQSTPAPFVDEQQVAFPYLSTAEQPIAPISQRSFDDISALRFEYANGFILNLKKTDFKNNQVIATLHFGSGRKSQPQKGLDMVSAAVINGSGTGTLRKSQLSEALSGSSVHYRFEVGEESFALQGSTVSAEIELLLQVFYSLIQDPGFREDAYRMAMKEFESMYGNLEHSVEGSAHLFLDSFFTGDIPGSGMGSWDQIKTIELQQIVDWLIPYFRRAPLELSIVGDFDPEQVQRLASIYFAGLPERSMTSSAAGTGSVQALFPVGDRLDISVDAPVDKGLIRVGWLTDDYWDISRTRRLHVLAAVFEDRLRQVIREELGTSYSPSAYATASRIYPAYGAVYAEVIVEAAALDKVLQVIEEIAESLVNDPVDETELARSREPITTSLKDSFRTNRYWLHSVLSLSARHEEQLVWPLSMISDFSSVSAEEINRMAQTYFRDERRAVGVISSHDSVRQH